ncbi:acylneuraminate cytidylyltransferase family protein [Polaribacter sp. KT 15]|uniref:acylneuraminate cytidylyltransferase family protein n=1 Tax=Polaribacter sp. KT 15 TaxID=1896175 RepID=UPI00090B1982|nr:acylneuraminate cytidylyltransferase family protein [Polaribacter sp. KT 15]SHN09681.1 N-acylneuraminate cytidylyltransferase [Polaribacter sp. KT 15]
MKILGIIPARGGSKGLPRKNIKMLGDKPLLQYTSEVALESDKLDLVVLSSDDDEIIDIGKRLGLTIPFKRPQVLAEDNSSSLSVIKHVLNFYLDKNVHFDAICLLQVTSPFRTKEFLDKAIETFINNKSDSLVSVLEVPHEYNPHWTFKDNEKGLLDISTGDKNIISRRQDLPKSYHRDGSIYITKTSVILDENSLYGSSISYIVSPKEYYVNIDTVKDWEKAENLLNNIS